MTWWKRRKCATCKKVLKAKHPIHEIRIEAADGNIELEVCEDCARFWDKSAEVLSSGRKKKKRRDLEADETLHGDDDT